MNGEDKSESKSSFLFTTLINFNNIYSLAISTYKRLTFNDVLLTYGSYFAAWTREHYKLLKLNFSLRETSCRTKIFTKCCVILSAE